MCQEAFGEAAPATPALQIQREANDKGEWPAGGLHPWGSSAGGQRARSCRADGSGQRLWRGGRPGEGSRVCAALGLALAAGSGDWCCVSWGSILKVPGGGGKAGGAKGGLREPRKGNSCRGVNNLKVLWSAAERRSQAGDFDVVSRAGRSRECFRILRPSLLSTAKHLFREQLFSGFFVFLVADTGPVKCLLCN